MTPGIGNSASQDFDAPWLARKDWAKGDLYYHMGVTGVLGNLLLLAFGLALLLAAYLFASGMPDLLRTSGYFALIPLLIVGPAGFLMTTQAVRVMIGGAKTGGVHFHLATVPFPLGGPLRGELRMSKPIPAGTPIRLRLNCVNWTETERRQLNNDTDFSTNSSVVWEDEETVTSDGSGTIPVSFVTPADAPATKEKPKNWTAMGERIKTIQWIEWNLIAEDPSEKKQGYHAQFELPVFKVAETASQVAEAESIRASRKSEIESYQPGADFKVRITPTVDGGTQFWFPPVRGGANAVFQTVVFLIMAAIVAGFSGPVFNRIVTGGMQAHDFVGLILYLGFAAVTVMFFFWILRLWFAPEIVVIANGMVSFTYSIFAKTRKMPTAEVVAVHVIAGQHTRKYAIRIKGSGWHYLDVGDGTREKRDAEWLALQMSHAIGVKAAPSIPGYGGAEQMEILTSFVRDFGGGRVLPKIDQLMKAAESGPPPGKDGGNQ